MYEVKPFSAPGGKFFALQRSVSLSSRQLVLSRNLGLELLHLIFVISNGNLGLELLYLIFVISNGIVVSYICDFWWKFKNYSCAGDCIRVGSERYLNIFTYPFCFVFKVTCILKAEDQRKVHCYKNPLSMDLPSLIIRDPFGIFNKSATASTGGSKVK